MSTPGGLHTKFSIFSIPFIGEPAALIVPALAEAPVEPETDGAGTVSTAGDHGENPPYPLCARDRVIMNAMANFLRSIRVSFTRAQAHAMLRSILILMVIVPNTAVFLELNDHLGPSQFVTMLDMAGNIRNVPEEPRLRSYLVTDFCAIVARLDPAYPNDPRAFHMAQFVSILRVE